MRQRAGAGFQLFGLALLLSSCAAAGAHAAAVEYDYSLSIDSAARSIEGRGFITLSGGGEAVLALGRRFEITRARADDIPVGPADRGAGGVQRWKVDGARRIEVEWRGELAALDATLDHRGTLGATAPVSGQDGTFLPDASRWYPRIEGALARYRVALDLPEGERGLVPGRLVEESTTGGRYRARFEFPHPAEGIDLMAGPYQVSERMMRGADGAALRLRTYFHPSVAPLAASYLESVQGYIKLYESWIGAYPFAGFSVVSSPTPTGFGMPALTYLGIDVLRLPFIRATSLGHEVLHNWWGNGVYPDFARGNWSEGLTTFMADYAYKERESAAAAAEMRLQWLRDFAALALGQDKPLAAFTSRTHGASQIVGYNKAAMVFFMLRDKLGRAAFDRGLQAFWQAQRFRVAGWDELRRAFESASGADLRPFFEQWLSREGAPQVRIADAERIADDTVRVTLVQAAPVWRIDVPLTVRTMTGEETRTAAFDRERASFTFTVAARPLAVALDPQLRLFRRLAREEAPPILREVMVDPATATLLLAPQGAVRSAAAKLAAQLQDHAPRVIAAETPLPAAPVLVIGLREEIDTWLARSGLAQRPEAVRGKGTAQAWTARRGDGATLAVVSARDVDALAAVARPLTHYGRQSYVVFEGARAIERGAWPAQVQMVEVR